MLWGKLLLIPLMVIFAALSIHALDIDVQNLRCGSEVPVITDEIVKGSVLAPDIKFTSFENNENVQITVYIAGFEHDNIRETTDVFSIRQNLTYYKFVILRLPENMEEGSYTLRYVISSRAGDDVVCNENIFITSRRHDLTIKDAAFSPNARAGHSTEFSLSIKNTGQKDQETVKVNLRLEGLGISETVILDDLQVGQIKDADLIFHIPSCVEPGLYLANLAIEFHDGDYVINDFFSFRISEGDRCTQLSQAGSRGLTAETAASPTNPVQTTSSAEQVVQNMANNVQVPRAQPENGSISDAEFGILALALLFVGLILLVLIWLIVRKK